MSITDGALVAAAQLADRYVNDRFLPDKAIDLIDEAGARLRIRRMTAPPELRELDEQIAEARRDKESAIDEQDFEKAARLRDTEKQLTAKRAEREKAWKSGDLDSVAEVDEELIAEVLALATGIPVVKLTEEESSRLLRMEDELHKRVVGQNDAIKALSQAIRRTRAGLKDPKRPGGSFIFAGPTGVGKTELAKALAEFLFGDEDALIQLDMSEYSEKHTVSRLFGSPPGYVGYDEGGQLTEKVRRRPFSVVLFDEVEKAHADIFNSLLQILEDGRLTDSQGRVVDFKNTIIIMTTNLGTRDIAKGLQTGFQAGGDLSTDYERMKAKVNDELKQHFRPEFLNRVDDVVVFPQLSQDEIIQIVDLMIAKLETRLKDKDMGLELTPAAKQLLAEKGYDPVLGARPLRRAIQREIEDALSEKILFGELRPGQTVVVDAQGEGLLGEFIFLGKGSDAADGDTEPVGVSVASMPPLTTTDDAPAGRRGLNHLPRRPRPHHGSGPSSCVAQWAHEHDRPDHRAVRGGAPRPVRRADPAVGPGAWRRGPRARRVLAGAVRPGGCAPARCGPGAPRVGRVEPGVPAGRGGRWRPDHVRRRRRRDRRPAAGGRGARVRPRHRAGPRPLGRRAPGDVGRVPQPAREVGPRRRGPGDRGRRPGGGPRPHGGRGPGWRRGRRAPRARARRRRPAPGPHRPGPAGRARPVRARPGRRRRAAGAVAGLRRRGRGGRR